MKKVVNIAATILIVLSLFFCYRGFDKKNNYYNSEVSSQRNVNVYVGGDAYNYIINSGYFAGYMAISGACLIGGILIIGFNMLNQKIMLNKSKNDDTPDVEPNSQAENNN